MSSQAGHAGHPPGCTALPYVDSLGQHSPARSPSHGGSSNLLRMLLHVLHICVPVCHTLRGSSVTRDAPLRLLARPMHSPLQRASRVIHGHGMHVSSGLRPGNETHVVAESVSWLRAREPLIPCPRRAFVIRNEYRRRSSSRGSSSRPIRLRCCAPGYPDLQGKPRCWRSALRSMLASPARTATASPATPLKLWWNSAPQSAS